MKRIIIFVLSAGILIASCSVSGNRSVGVYLLLDTSGINSLELKKAQTIINYLLKNLQPNDTLAVAGIDTGSFGEKNIIAKITFDQRPSVANNQKRAFQKQVGDYVAHVKKNPYTDISGGILQAIEYLNEAGSGNKYILIFSDLKEELARGYVRYVPFQLEGFSVVALNITKLRTDIRDPEKYLGRAEEWRAKVETGNGKWRVANDLDRLENVFTEN